MNVTHYFPSGLKPCFVSLQRGCRSYTSEFSWEASEGCKWPVSGGRLDVIPGARLHQPGQPPHTFLSSADPGHSVSHWRHDHKRPWDSKGSASLRREVTSPVPEPQQISICTPGSSGLWTRPAASIIRARRPCCVTSLCHTTRVASQTQRRRQQERAWVRELCT